MNRGTGWFTYGAKVTIPVIIFQALKSQSEVSQPDISEARNLILTS